MANNYTTFSFSFGESFTPQQREQAVDLLTIVGNAISEEYAGDLDLPKHFEDWRPLIQGFVKECIDADQGYFNVCIVKLPNDDYLWANSGDESGDPDSTAQFISLVLEIFNSDEIVGFTWAETCSKLRLDEFGGGYYVATADKVFGEGAHSMLATAIERLKKGEGLV